MIHRPALARCILLLLVVPLTAGLAQKAPFTAEDLFALRRVTAAEINPQGTAVAFTVEQQRSATQPPGSSWSELYVVSTTAGTVRAFITGEERVTGIAWRPDGSAISFLSKRRDDSETQVWMIPIGGGEARRITSSPTPVLLYTWLPDGRSLVYVATRPKSDREKALEKAGFEFEVFEENVRPRLLYHQPIAESGPIPAPRSLTREGAVWAVEAFPAGSTVVARLSPKNLIDQDYMSSQLHRIDVTSGSMERIVETPGKLGPFAVSPDGKTLAFIGARDRRDNDASRLFVVPMSGGTATDITPREMRGHMQEVAWQDAATLLCLSSEGVWNNLFTLPARGGARTMRLEGSSLALVIKSPSMAGDPGTISFIGESSAIPGDVYVTVSRSPKRLTTLNASLADRSLGDQTVIRYRARDSVEIEGLLLLPPSPSPVTNLPLVVIVHGGPESHYSNGWVTRYSEPGHILAGKGYAVFYPNYRASTGYGPDFALMGYGDAAGREFDDIADGIEHLIARGIADRSRVGMAGGSYGGFASAWFATYYTRAAKAVCMFVGISNIISKFGTTDIPEEEIAVHAGRPVYEQWSFALERSPIRHAQQSRTATLILGGLADTRVHPSQSMELYRHMKVQKHPAVRLVRYPGEGHGNARQPGRIDLLLRSLEWLDWYVRDAKPLDGPMPPADLSDRYGIPLPEGSK